jgi:hypothetical protein
VTGQAAFDLDFIVVLRPILLPLKAVVMNFLSITASYGALVWIFQEGHLARWLGFTPGPIESPIPLIMFCVLFGLSMDYEVLLLSRTREEYERTGDNRQAVAASLERTGRLITGAASIMAVVFFGFGVAHAVMIKAIGIGMGSRSWSTRRSCARCSCPQRCGSWAAGTGGRPRRWHDSTRACRSRGRRAGDGNSRRSRGSVYLSFRTSTSAHAS